MIPRGPFQHLPFCDFSHVFFEVNVAIRILVLKTEISKGSYVITDLLQLYLRCVGDMYTHCGSVCSLGNVYDKSC